MKPLSQCIQAAQKMGEQEQDYNYNLKKQSNYNYNAVQSPKNRYKGTVLYRHINESPLFKVALSWGMSGGLLYNLCQAHGIEVVEASIELVQQLPEAKRNGRYCRTVILNGGPAKAQMQPKP